MVIKGGRTIISSFKIKSQTVRFLRIPAWLAEKSTNSLRVNEYGTPAEGEEVLSDLRLALFSLFALSTCVAEDVSPRLVSIPPC